MFFGRSDELAQLRGRLANGDSTNVVGLRRIGKSSLLYQLANQSDALQPGSVAVYVDLQDATHRQPLDLLNSALRGIDQQLGKRYGFANQSVASLAEFSTAIKRVAADHFRPILCLDEVEVFLENDEFDDDFLNNLRSLANQRVLSYVTAASDSLDVLLKQNSRTSHFYNVFTNLQLGGLSDTATVDLLTRPFSSMGLTPPSDAQVHMALDVAGHYPFYLQITGGVLFERLAQQAVVDRDSLRDAFRRQAERHLVGLWRSLGADEQAGVKLLAGVPAVLPDADWVKKQLAAAGIAEDLQHSPRLFSSVFAEMVADDSISRDTSVRRVQSSAPEVSRQPQAAPPEPPTQASNTPAIAMMAAYLAVVIAAAALALVIALLLPTGAFWTFFVILAVVLTFVLVGADKISGGQFVDFMGRILGRWER
jgi:hypothetical protein